MQRQQLPPGPGPGPRAPQGCDRLPAPCCRPYSQFHLTPGPDVKGHRHRASSESLPPAHIPRQSGLPTSQQSQHLNNGAVWLQALTLHRAGLEHRHSAAVHSGACQQEASPPSQPPTSLGRKPRDPLSCGWPRQRPRKRPGQEQGWHGHPSPLPPYPAHARRCELRARAYIAQARPQGFAQGTKCFKAEGREAEETCILDLKCQDKWGSRPACGPTGETR